MKRILLVAVVVLTTLANLFSQEAQFEWAGAFEGMNSYIQIHESGYVYVIGNFSGTSDFDLSFTSQHLVSTSTLSVFAAKYTLEGQFVSVKTYSGPSTGEGAGNVISADVDPLGNIHLVTKRSGAASNSSEPISNSKAPINKFWFTYLGFDVNSSNIWTESLYYFSSYALPDFTFKVKGSFTGRAYVTRFMTNAYPFGTVWFSELNQGTTIYELHETGFEAPIRNFHISNTENLFCSGSFADTKDFDPDTTEYVLSSEDGVNYVCKLSSTYDLIWAKQFSDQFRIIEELTTDHAGNVYVAGQFYDSTDFNPDTTQTFCLSSAGQHDVFIMKLDASGNFVWAKQIGGGGLETLSDLKYLNDSSLVLSIYYSGNVDFDPGAGEFFLNYSGTNNKAFVKLDLDGNFMDAHSLNEDGMFTVTNTDFDLAGNILQTGAFMTTGDFDPGQGAYYISNPGLVNTFVRKLTISDTLESNFFFNNGDFYTGDLIPFYDISTGNPTSWYWDFGDGSTSNDRFPEHIYSNAGTYSISLGSVITLVATH